MFILSEILLILVKSLRKIFITFFPNALIIKKIAILEFLYLQFFDFFLNFKNMAETILAIIYFQITYEN